MKTYPILLTSIVAVLVVASGCNKQETAPAAATEPTKQAAPAAAEVQKAQDAVQQQAASAQATAPKAASDAQPPAVPAPDEVNKAVTDIQTQAAAGQKSGEKTPADPQAQASISSKAQKLIDAATKYVADKNWSEALKSLTDVSALKLTPEQQTTVNSLKQQVEAAAAGKTADQGVKAVDDLLHKK